MAPSDRPVIEKERRGQQRGATDRWQTALTYTAPNQILVRGYPLDEMMGRVSFADAVYLLVDGRAADAGDRPDAECGARVVDRSRRDAAFDAGRAQRRRLSGAAQGLCRRRHPRIRPAPRRRHRIVHAIPRRRPRPGPRRQIASGSGGRHRRRIRPAAAGAARIRSPVPHAGSAGQPLVPDGPRARARRRARPADPRGRARARGAARPVRARLCR